MCVALLLSILFLFAYAVANPPDRCLMTAELRTVDLSKLTKEQKRAFFCNVYQLIAIHGHGKHGLPTTMIHRKTLHDSSFYLVGGSEYR